MLKTKRLFWVGLLLVLAVLITGCGDGGGSSSSSTNTATNPDTPTTPDTGPFLTLQSKVMLDISSFSGKTIYSLIAAMPTSKPENNGTSSVATYPFVLSATAPNGTTSDAGDEISDSSLVSNSQAALDIKLRNEENSILKSNKPQITKSTISKNAFTKGAITVGTTWNNMNIIHTANDSWTTISATCQYVSNYAYIFVDNRNTSAMASKVETWGAKFDKIYTTNRNHFGNQIDTDGNGKVIIVVSEEVGGGTLGYFYARDKYSTSDYPYSNQGDMFYLTTAYDGDYVYGAMAHEFQHMIYFDQHCNKGVTNTYSWLNEALSQAAEYYNGYTITHLNWIRSFLSTDSKSLSLTCWSSLNYGYGAIFIRYLIDQYGDTAIKNMCSTDKVGIAAVENVTRTDFNTIFLNFSRALVLSGTSETFSNARYRFTSLDLKSIQPSGRGGLLPFTQIYSSNNCAKATTGTYPYRVIFLKWTGNIASMYLTGYASSTGSLSGTVFGLTE